MADLGLEQGIEPLAVVDHTSPPPVENINEMLGVPVAPTMPAVVPGFHMPGLNDLPGMNK